MPTLPARPLPPAIGATENALRRLLAHALADSLIRSYDEWVYLNIADRTGGPTEVEALVADALQQPPEVAAAVRAGLIHGGLLDASGSLTAAAREVLRRCRATVAEFTETLVAGIDPTAMQTTLDTLDVVRASALRLMAR